MSTTPPNPLENQPAPAPAPAIAHSQKVTCEFCGCQLTPNGEIIRMGDNARKFRKHDEDVEKLNATISSQQSEIATLTAKLAELNPPAPDASRRRSGIVVSSS